MACLVLVCDVEHAPLVDLAASITGYALQSSKEEVGRNTIIAYERKAFTPSSIRQLRASNREGVPTLSINLRGLSGDRRDAAGDATGRTGSIMSTYSSVESSTGRTFVGFCPL